MELHKRGSYNSSYICIGSGAGERAGAGSTASCRQYGMLFSVGSMGKTVFSWGKKMQLLLDKGSIGIVLTFRVNISYSTE